jgi:hypothetical protein
MVRFVVLFLVLSLLAPLAIAASPETPNRPLTGLFDSLWNLWEAVVAWLTPQNNGAFIVPTGVAEPFTEDDDTTSTLPANAENKLSTEENGAFIVPSG